MRVRLVAPGPLHHGVVRHSATLARLLRRSGADVASHDQPVDVVHAQFTDALWGADVSSAAAAFTRWSAAVRAPLVVTLHDVPGADAEPLRDERRRRGYAQIVVAADVVVVSSRHEAAKIAAATGRAAEVIELPVEPLPAGPRPGWADRPTLGVLGFVYPGKGHADVIDAARHVPGRPRIVAAGAVSPGHAQLWSELADLAAAAGVDLVSTGPLDDAAMGAAAHAVTVPVVPGRTVSASGTLATWWAAGRRPLVADTTYALEQARGRPDALVTYGPGGLTAAATGALAEPASTVLTGPRFWPDAGAAHLRVYANATTVRC